MSAPNESEFFGQNYEVSAEAILRGQTDEEVSDLEAHIHGLGVSSPRVLDAACGFGRISIPLLDRGIDVVGVDLSPDLIQAAREKARKRGHDPKRFSVVDLTKKPSNTEKFDCVISWHHSIGLGSGEGDQSIIRNLLERLSSKGDLIIQVLNQWAVVRHLNSSESTVFETNVDETQVTDEVTFIPHESTLLTQRLTTRGREVSVSRLTARLYAPAELKRLIEEGGGEVVGFKGDRLGDQLGIESANVTVVARVRPDRSPSESSEDSDHHEGSRRKLHRTNPVETAMAISKAGSLGFRTGEPINERNRGLPNEPV